MSTASAAVKNERAEHRAVLALFALIAALAGVGIVVSVVANSVMGTHRHMASMGSGWGPSTAPAVVVPSQIELAVVPGGKVGPKGEKYDAFTKTNFNVRVNRPMQLTIDNKDDVVHSITSTAAGVNIVVMPGKHTYTLVVHQAGRFKWICAYPCDPFSMETVGYMQGYIQAT